MWTSMLQGGSAANRAGEQDALANGCGQYVMELPLQTKCSALGLKFYSQLGKRNYKHGSTQLKAKAFQICK